MQTKSFIYSSYSIMCSSVYSPVTVYQSIWTNGTSDASNELWGESHTVTLGNSTPSVSIRFIFSIDSTCGLVWNLSMENRWWSVVQYYLISFLKFSLFFLLALSLSAHHVLPFNYWRTVQLVYIAMEYKRKLAAIVWHVQQ